MTPAGAFEAVARILEDEGHKDVAVYEIVHRLDEEGGFELVDFVAEKTAMTAEIRYRKEGTGTKSAKLKRYITVWSGWQDEPDPEDEGDEDEKAA